MYRQIASSALLRALIGCLLLTAFAACDRGESEHFTRAHELERKVLMRGGEINYADPAYLKVARELEEVSPFSSDYARAQEKLRLIKDARRIKANEVYQLDYLPSRLEGVSLASLAPAQPDAPGIRRSSTSSSSSASAPAAASDGAADGNVPAGGETSAATAGEGAAATVTSTSDQAVASKSRKASKYGPVILYSTSWCGYCRKARAYFNQHQVAYVDKDIEQDMAAQREMVSKVGGYGGVPVIDIDGTIIRGFDLRGIESALARREQ
jgi:glutaredoxin